MFKQTNVFKKLCLIAIVFKTQVWPIRAFLIYIKSMSEIEPVLKQIF